VAASGPLLAEKLMLMCERFGIFLLMDLLYVYAVHAQDAKPLSVRDSGPIHLSVEVTEKSGAPVSDLQLEDLTLLDNNVPRTITSFEAVDGREAQIEIVLVIDAVNSSAREVAIEREEVKRFLKVEQGRLAYPTTFAVLTETGIQLHLGLSKDGKALSSALDHQRISLRGIDQNTVGGRATRFENSFEGFAQLLGEEREKPGRKLVVWMSPGWPIVGHKLDAEQRQHIFRNVLEISKQLREGQITLYSIDPSGTTDTEPGLTDPVTIHLRPSDHAYVEAATNSSEAELSHLALTVIAMQSGGLTLHPGNDIASELRKCVADAGAYYEVSFSPTSTNQPNEYHRLAIHVAKPGLVARTTQGYYSRHAGSLTDRSEQPDKADDSNFTKEVSAEGAVPPGADAEIYANVHPYLDWPLAQLTASIPELKALQPAVDQQQLPFVLQNMGWAVDDFVRNVGDLIADEDVRQEKLNSDGTVQAKERVQDSYLILHHGYEWGASAEYRMDDKGNRVGPIGLSKGYLVTSGYALSCITFSTIAQPQSRFRLLGEQKIGRRDAYVLGFAQRPGQVTFTTVMKGTSRHEVDVLTQGILWVDKNSLQILRMRSDLLAANKEIQLDRLTTDVTFGVVRLQEVPSPLWLPSDVAVYIEIGGDRFRNLHHYTNYRRYRVSVEIGAPQ
jgi:VWFA-related protein